MRKQSCLLSEPGLFSGMSCSFWGGTSIPLYTPMFLLAFIENTLQLFKQTYGKTAKQLLGPNPWSSLLRMKQCHKGH